MKGTAQLQKTTLNEIAQHVLAGWRRHHGTDTGEAFALAGDRCLVVFIENAFSRAEVSLAAQQSGDRTLERYVKSLLEHVCVEQAARLEATAHVRVISRSVSVDPEAGWVMCFYKLERNLEGVFPAAN